MQIEFRFWSKKHHPRTDLRILLGIQVTRNSCVKIPESEAILFSFLQLLQFIFFQKAEKYF